MALWFLGAGNLPMSLARPIIEWRLLSSTRPAALSKIGGSLQRLLRRARKRR